MKIADEDQLSTDFDWFATDEVGHVGHFTSAGYKLLPPTVSASKEDLERVTSYFFKVAPRHTAFEVDPDLEKELCEWNGIKNESRYLQSFTSMAERGLFSFDVASHLNDNAAYFRVAFPVAPLNAHDLPSAIKQIVIRTKLPGINLASCSRIPYALTLEI